MLRVKREKSRDKSRSPRSAGHPDNQREEEQSAHDVEEDIGEVVSAGIHAPQLNIEHVGYPRQRVPIGCVVSRHRPKDVRDAESRADVVVTDDIIFIVEPDELEMRHLSVDCKDGKQQEYADKDAGSGA